MARGPPAGSWEILLNAVDTGGFAPADRPPRATRAPLAATSHRRTGWRPRSRRSRCYRTRGCSSPAPSSAGTSSSRSSVSQTASSFVGRYAQRDAPALYRARTYSSTPRCGTLSQRRARGLACGVPVVHSASGGVPELVGDAGIGVASETTWERDVPPAPAELAEAVRAVLASLGGTGVAHAHERSSASISRRGSSATGRCSRSSWDDATRVGS